MWSPIGAFRARTRAPNMNCSTRFWPTEPSKRAAKGFHPRRWISTTLIFVLGLGNVAAAFLADDRNDSHPEDFRVSPPELGGNYPHFPPMSSLSGLPSSPTQELSSAATGSPQGSVSNGDVAPAGKKAVIVTDQAVVRAGPGFGYYPTQVLRRGERVEVFHLDPNGWLAIRPPQGSFSWVRAEDVAVGEDGLAEVLRNDTPSFIGSLLGSARHYAPIKLRKGEILEVLQGEDSPKLFVSGPGSRDSSSNAFHDAGWIKIAPPAGEFRWIEKRAVRFLEGEELQTVQWSPEESPGESTPISEWKALSPQEQPPATSEARSFQTPYGRPNQGPFPASEQLPYARPQSGAVREWVARSQPTEQPPDGSKHQPASYQQELEGLTLRLAQTLLSPVGQWEVEPLAKKCEELMKKPLPPPTREEARVLATRIYRALELKRRFEAQQRHVETPEVAGGSTSAILPQDPIPSSHHSANLGQLSSGSSPQFPPYSQRETTSPDLPQTAEPPANQTFLVSRSGGNRFDATGRLMRVLPAQWGVPRYALVDEAGNIRAFLTPAPGLNLEYYLGRQIGVHGTCSSFGDKQTLHVMVKSVTPLERFSQR